MPEILMKDGKLATKADYEASDIVKQMLQESQEKAKADALKDAPTKEKIIQSLTVEDVKELAPVKELTKDVPTKETVLQTLTVEDAEKLPEAVVTAIVEKKGTIVQQAGTFLKTLVSAAKGEGSVNPDDPPKKSLNQVIKEQMG
jgi:hypothetical protein